MSTQPATPPALAADAQISDQSLLTIMEDAQKYICKICENLQTHAGIQVSDLVGALPVNHSG